MSLLADFHLRIGAFDLRANLCLEGGITALFGPSGAGKTLTLRCLAGLARPESGRIVLAGRTLLDTAARLDRPPRERRIGYVFQQYALFPHLSVAQNIAFGIPHLEAADRDARIADLLDLMDLRGLGARRPGHLSGGQQQRVALARALATEPQLLLLDEPFAAVDLRLRLRLRRELRRIHEVTATPMLLVTHDLAEVRQLSDSLILMDQGRVVLSGLTAPLLADPLDPELAGMIGE